MMKNKILAAILLCIAPSLVFAERVSINSLATKIDGKPELRFVQLVNDVLDGNNVGFQIRVLCDEAFNVKSVYATARDENGPVNINYSSVNLLGNPFGPGFSAPTNWLVAHLDFAVTAVSSSVGFELLSNMNVPSLGVGARGSFDISGSRNPNTQTTTMTIGAVVETSNNPDNNCRIVIVDF